jgi:hypothetical protein
MQFLDDFIDGSPLLMLLRLVEAIGFQGLKALEVGGMDFLSGGIGGNSQNLKRGLPKKG